MTVLPLALHGTPCSDIKQSPEDRGTSKCWTRQKLSNSSAEEQPQAGRLRNIKPTGPLQVFNVTRGADSSSAVIEALLWCCSPGMAITANNLTIAF